jgi:hypothetical protein
MDFPIGGMLHQSRGGLGCTAKTGFEQSDGNGLVCVALSTCNFHGVYYAFLTGVSGMVIRVIA